MAEPRGVIFLYTDAAQIDARTRKAMTASGFLPVKVASLDAVRLIEAPLAVPSAEISEILRAALIVLNNTGSDTAFRYARENFVLLLTDRLIKASEREEKARADARRELDNAGA
jgi:hypothetical protein